MAVPGAGVVGVVGPTRGTPTGTDIDVVVTVKEDVNAGGATGFVGGAGIGATVGIGMPPGICAVVDGGVVTDTKVDVEVNFVGPVGLETSHALLNRANAATTTSIRGMSEAGPTSVPMRKGPIAPSPHRSRPSDPDRGKKSAPEQPSSLGKLRHGTEVCCDARRKPSISR